MPAFPDVKVFVGLEVLAKIQAVYLSFSFRFGFLARGAYGFASVSHSGRPILSCFLT
jgi:hypothetical protein